MDAISLIFYKQFIYMLCTIYICILSKNRYYMSQQ